MKALLIFVCILASSILLVGCQDDTAGSPPPKPMTETQLNNQITAIQNNPSIPPQGKEIAIRQIKAAYATMSSHAQSASKGQKPAAN